MAVHAAPFGEGQQCASGEPYLGSEYGSLKAPCPSRGAEIEFHADVRKLLISNADTFFLSGSSEYALAP